MAANNSTIVQIRRGTTAQTASFTGALAEITVDTDQKTIVVHDGVTLGGTTLSTKAFTSVDFPTPEWPTNTEVLPSNIPRNISTSLARESVFIEVWII